MTKHYDLFIDGNFTACKSGESFTHFNPTDLREEVHSCAWGGSEDVEAAILSAEKAQPSWAALSVLERNAILRKCTNARDGDERNWPTLPILRGGAG